MYVCRQCFDAVGWVAGRASGLQKNEWWGAGMVICLEQGADLHMAQLMPLPLTLSCFSKIQIGFTFLVPAYPRSPRKKADKRVCVCMYAWSILPSVFQHCWLGVRKSIPPVKNRLMRRWCGYLSGGRCRLFAYRPADATTSQNPNLLPHLNPDWLHLWYRLTQLVLEKRPINRLCSSK